MLTEDSRHNMSEMKQPLFTIIALTTTTEWFII